MDINGFMLKIKKETHKRKNKKETHKQKRNSQNIG